MLRRSKANPSTKLSANLTSKLFFWWLKPIFIQGKAHDLKSDDLHDALPTDVSELLGGRLEKYWKTEVENARQSNRKPKLVNAIRKAFGWSYFYYSGHMLILSCLRILQPLVLGLLLQYFIHDSETTKTQAYIYACSLILLTFLHSLLKHHIDLDTLEIGMRLRIACSSLIYRKVVRLSSVSMGAATVGRVVNLLSNDVARFDPLFMYLHYIWLTPIQGCLITYLIWRNVQVASIVGVVIMALETIPVQIYVGKITSRLRAKIATKTDERVRLMSEIINGIHVIKMYTWEKPFECLVSLARRYEIDVITSMSYLRGVTIASNAFVDRTCLYFTIMAYVLAGNVISADKVFSMVQYFTILQNLLAYNYPRAIFNAAEARVSIKRIENFLLLDEIKIKAPLLSVEDNASISLKSATASWTPNTITNTLHDITSYFSPKKLHVIVGPVGSGKSSLLQLILGELKSSSGDVKINGIISYASQRPWIFPGTLRDNVLFDQPYDETRYRAVLRACALERDVESLPHGDLVQVGERGSNLSGGQSARLNLARAVYKDADIYIFDDPFSAVDARVCKCLFNDCINGYLKDKTRIFVTYQVQCLKEADTVILLNNGKIEFQGKFTDFSKKDLQFLHVSSEEETKEPTQEILENKNVSNINQDGILSKLAQIDKDIEKGSPEAEELIAKGKMNTSIFSKYFKNRNSCFFLISTVLVFILAQIIRSGSDYWLAYWTHSEELRFEALKTITSSSTMNPANTTEIMLSNATSTTTLELILSTTENIMTSTTENIITSTTENIITSTTENIITSTTESLMTNTTENVLLNTITNAVLNTTNNLLTTAKENLLSDTTEQILSTSTTNAILNLTTNILSNVTENVLLNTTPNSLSSTVDNLLLNTSGTAILKTNENLSISTTIENLLPSRAEKLVSNLNEMFNESLVTSAYTELSDYLDLDVALIIYGCILLGCVVSAVSKCLLFFKICMNSSKNIHNTMFSCVLKAPKWFFDKQTSGQILNRFSKDTGAMDEILPVTMYESIEVFSIILGIVIQVLIINWWSLLPMILTGYLYWKIRNFYVPTAYEIKRLEGAGKSPVLSHVTASLDGLVTIRSSRGQTAMCRQFDVRQDLHTRAHYLGIAVASAFGLWLDLVSVILVSFVTLGSLFTDKSNTFAGGVGLAITQILMLCGMLQRGIRQTAETTTQMTSVERILQFTQLEQEDSDGLKPPSGWPSGGKIEFRQFSLCHSKNDEPILRNVNLIIEPGAKVGIVGRTGAGKSSLISALFRLAHIEGQVLIDDIDISGIGLYEMRKRIAIIPQEPVLFSASLRDNLDPFHEFENTQLWAALEDVELHKAFVPLDHPIECGGRNLSGGQRQLLCLARAIVKKTRILVLDEATANVDPATDALIRKTIRNKFQDCTVLTVAHRLESVIDNDKILVIEDGEIVEYEHPYTLLKNENGQLYRMAKLTGATMFEHLSNVAQETYLRLKNQLSSTSVIEERANTNGVVKNNDILETDEKSVDN